MRAYGDSVYISYPNINKVEKIKVDKRIINIHKLNINSKNNINKFIIL